MTKQPDHTTRNTLTVGLFVGSLAGFFVAMLLGVFKYQGDSSATDWVVAVTAVAAAFISALAVVLVAQTLQATRETLKATQKMGEDQKKSDDLKTRPWLLYTSLEFTFEPRATIANVRFKNFGPTPARQAIFAAKLIGRNYPRPGERNTSPVFEYRGLFEKKLHIPPGEEVIYKVTIPENEIMKSDYYTLILEWSYYTHDHTMRYTPENDESATEIELTMNRFGTLTLSD